MFFPLVHLQVWDDNHNSIETSEFLKVIFEVSSTWIHFDDTKMKSLIDWTKSFEEILNQFFRRKFTCPSVRFQNPQSDQWSEFLFDKTRKTEEEWEAFFHFSTIYQRQKRHFVRLNELNARNTSRICDSDNVNELKISGKISDSLCDSSSFSDIPPRCTRRTYSIHTRSGVLDEEIREFESCGEQFVNCFLSLSYIKLSNFSMTERNSRCTSTNWLN